MIGSMERKRPNASPRRLPLTDTSEIERREQSLDEALKGTFPASDPPSALAPHRSCE
jgi:hypothetical protein